MNSERNRAGRAGFFCKEQFAAPLSSIVSRLFGKACTPCTNPPGSMAFNAPRKAVEETGEVGEGRAHAAHLLHERCMSWEKPHTTVLMSAWRLVDKGSRFFAGARRRELQQHLIAVDHAHRFASSALYMSPVGTPRALLGEQVYPQFCRAELVGRGALRTQASETWSEG